MAKLRGSRKHLAWLLLAVAGAATAGPLPVWELETEGNSVRIMGSVHLLRESDYPLPEGLLEAYDPADKLVMEIDMDNVDSVAMSGIMMKLATDPQGKSLRELIGAEAYDEATAKAGELGVPLAMFSQYEPWFAALSISQLRMMQLGFDPNWGVEMQMVKRAKRDGKPIFGLETLEEQLSFMDGLDADTQRQFLLLSLDDAADVMEEVDTIVEAWRTGDTARMEALMLADMAQAPDLYDALLVQRNRSWVDSIKKLTRESDDYLVIVGAMHLVGEDSVLAMLEDVGIGSKQLGN